MVEFQARRIAFDARRGALVHADNLLTRRTPAVFEALQGAVQVIVGPDAPALHEPSAISRQPSAISQAQAMTSLEP